MNTFPFPAYDVATLGYANNEGRLCCLQCGRDLDYEIAMVGLDAVLDYLADHLDNYCPGPP